MTRLNQRDCTPIRLRTIAERDAFGAAVCYLNARGNGGDSGCDSGETSDGNRAVSAEEAFLEALEFARREILHQFVHGVLRGRPAGVPTARVVERESPAIPDAEGFERTAFDGTQLLEAVTPLPTTCRQLALLPFPASETVLVAPIARRHGYDRFRLVGPVSRLSTARSSGTVANARAAPSATRVGMPGELVSLLEREGGFSDAAQADRIWEEVAESVANLALARLATGVHARAVETAAETAETATDSPLEPIEAGIAAADDAAAFERIVTDGHPFHPAGKLRRGMTAADGLAYAPEFTDRVDLRFVAIERDAALETRSRGADGESLTTRLFRLFDGLEAALERAIPGSADAAAYAVVPVHPFQYHHTVPERYARQCASGRIVPIPECSRPATPQLNLRTVVPFESERTADGPLSHLKLAIDVQTTNVVRTLSPQAVTNGPRVTALMREIAARESFESLGIVPEPAATCYYPPGGSQPYTAGDEFDDARHLSALVRTNPLAHPLVGGADDAIPVVASSLLAESPATGRPLVRDLIERYATVTETTTVAEAALAFVDAYAGVVVPEQLRLLTTYGIALESHLQNSLLVLDRERAHPIGTLVRDLGGIRVHSGRLGEHGLSFTPYPDSDLDADGERDLHRKLYYALFQNHLAELVATIAAETAVDERACWVRIRAHCEQAFEQVRANTAVPNSRVRRDERALFAERATHKALTAMRLRGKRHEYVTSEVSNPLTPAGRAVIDPT
ncbi:IucA/IucC family protein [Natrialba taiwanensis]|uniref:IucA/IucC family protein n=1 Tax=Natrialba taiwanensis DSM 12281 TaxID=1230458 RepID=M0A1T5_9EURY|nr:IucA/IucC family protein [Natrialba taiwanensis]ELY92564.1 IucA/IucC family protein [Natrialba taiwanensis DSM 12281]